jgi:transitional endoplasmic reticulum ATPase
MQLTVRPTEKGRADSGLAVIDRESMAEIGVERGDYVLVEGPGSEPGSNPDLNDGGEGASAVAMVWPGERRAGKRGEIHVDGHLRRAIGAGVDDRVTVERTTPSDAQEIEIALPADIGLDGNLGLRFRDELADRALVNGQVLAVSFGFGSVSGPSGNSIPITITDTDPSGTVVVREWTDVTVSPAVADLPAAVGPSSASPADEPTAAGGPVAYEDVGGLDSEIERLRELLELPMRHPGLFDILGISPPKGVLLYGPPGTGKTLLARAFIDETGFSCRAVPGPELVSAYYGDGDELEDLVDELESDAPAILFIDELDAAAPDRSGAGGEAERRVITRLLSMLDGIDAGSRVAVLATTNRVEEIDAALRRPGRLGREIEVGVPDAAGREEIVRVHARGMPLAAGVDLGELAAGTHGFVGSDLEHLVNESAMNALRRRRPDIDLDAEAIDADVLESLDVTDADWRAALRGIEPSALREVFVEVPDVAWTDVGGLEGAKERLRETVQWPLQYADAFERVKLTPAKGVLLYGPPGTGKTLLAKAVANEAESNFISIKGPELLDKFVGESEKGVREIFSKARENAPTVIFFDEIDAIAGERGGNAGDSGVGERVVSQLLTELDGLEALEDVVVIATTNRPDLLDDALVRPGRLDRHVRVSVPDESAREEIFAVHAGDRPLANGVTVADLAARTGGYVGADIEAVCREAATAAVREFVRSADAGENADVAGIYLRPRHFDRALEDVAGSADGSTARFEGFDDRPPDRGPDSFGDDA